MVVKEQGLRAGKTMQISQNISETANKYAMQQQGGGWTDSGEDARYLHLQKMC